MLASDGSLRIKRLQIIPKMAVGVFVVVPRGQLPKIPSKTLATRIVLPGGTPAVPTPVTEAFRIGFEGRTGNDIHGSTLPHGQMMRGIE